MIKVDKSKVEMQGTVPMLLAELTCLCNSLKNIMVENGRSEAEAKDNLIHALELAFMSSEELDAEVKNVLLKIMMKGLGV